MPGVRSCFQAIVAVSANGVIGLQQRIPWNIPDEYRWFRRKTLGHHVLMGCCTYLGLPRTLDGRYQLVLTKRPEERLRQAPRRFAGIRRWKPSSGEVPSGTQSYLFCSVPDLEHWVESWKTDPPLIFVCGGAEIYRQLLPMCSELFLSRIHLRVEGDRFFPSLDGFERVGVIEEHEEFQVEHYRQREP